MIHLIRTFFIIVLGSFVLLCPAQQITGVWSGKINKKRAEIKFVQKGDSITGTSYYYESGKNYLRYSIKGYFDADNNSVVWWDDELISAEGNSRDIAFLSVADFNCPGDGKMQLDGTTTQKESRINTGDISLTKIISTSFPDEWDFVIDNYTEGTNDPDIIDSIGLVAVNKKKKPKIVQPPKEIPKEVVTNPVVAEPEPDPQVVLAQHTKKMEEQFTIRKKVFVTEIPLQGDSIELRFFDNVQVDGDSITLFLNDKLIFTHVRLTEKPFVVKLSVNDLNETNELTMVAENLGSIPPNTAYMEAIVGDKRYDVNLSSTEETSGMIRLKKPSVNSSGEGTPQQRRP